MNKKGLNSRFIFPLISLAIHITMFCLFSGHESACHILEIDIFENKKSAIVAYTSAKNEISSLKKMDYASRSSSEEAFFGNPKPPYPPLAKKLRQEGQAIVEIKVSKEGKVKDLIFKKTTGYFLLDDAIRDTLFKRWTISNPSQKDFWLRLPPFRFQLEKNL